MRPFSILVAEQKSGAIRDYLFLAIALVCLGSLANNIKGFWGWLFVISFITKFGI
jgi:hypothetical protein